MKLILNYKVFIFCSWCGKSALGLAVEVDETVGRESIRSVLRYFGVNFGKHEELQNPICAVFSEQVNLSYDDEHWFCQKMFL